MASRSSSAARTASRVLSIVLALAATATGGAQAPPDRSRAEALSKRAGDRLAALQREADRLASDERSLLNDLRKLEVERQLAAARVREIDDQAKSVQADIDETQSRIDRLESAEASARPELRARLVEMYKLGRARYTRLLLSASDLRRVGQASRTVAILAKLDRDRIAEHERTLGELRATRATLDERRRQLVSLRAAAQAAQAAAVRAAQSQNDLISDIDRRRDLNAQLAAELQTAQQKIQAELRDGAATDVALPVRPFRGDLDWPLEAATTDVRRRFGRTAGTGGSSSNGIDIAAADGAPVAAVHDGVVAFAGSFSGFGNLVILDHGSQTFSLYGDLLDVAVAKGARVERGQRLGAAGPIPGGGTGLYFELRVDGRPVDPLQWLRKR